MEELATRTGILRRTARFVRKRGLRRSLRRAFEAIDDVGSRILRGQTAYERWFADQPGGALLRARPRRRARPSCRSSCPYATPTRWLERALVSVRRQTYPRWQLCIADDASASPQVRTLLEQWRASEPRVELLHDDSRQGISRTSNRALSVARGEYVALLDHDDELTADALSLVVSRARVQPFDLLYSDEDKITRSGRLRDPAFKPDRSSDLLRTCMYFGHLCVYRRAFLEELGGFDPAFDGSQDWELALRADARGRAGSCTCPPSSTTGGWRTAPPPTRTRKRSPGPTRPVERSGRGRPRAARRARAGRRRCKRYARIVRTPQPDRLVSVLRGRDVAADPTEPARRRSGGRCDGPPAGGVRPGASGGDASRHAIGLEVEWLAIDRARVRRPRRRRALERGGGLARGDVLVFLDGVRPWDETGANAWGSWLAEIVATVERVPIGVAVGARISSRAAA
ncbi:MAG: glycosyltransferase [Myxococcota bacterium]